MLSGGYERLVGMKLRILTQLRKKTLGAKKIRVLDFGCGTGEIAAGLAADPEIVQVVGADESLGMIREARKRHRKISANIRWVCLRKADLDLRKFDWIIAVNTFHHIPPSRRASTARRLFAALAPGGLLTILEHNPRNPLTRWIVSRCPFDRGVQLLPVKEAKDLLRLGKGPVQVLYSGFCPPQFFGAEFIERLFSGLPWGAQYLASGLEKSVAVP
jgi:SAM-dependent methyltransferase